MISLFVTGGCGFIGSNFVRYVPERDPDVRVDSVVHFAAESHVDRSIQDCGPFVHTNGLGAQVLRETVQWYRGNMQWTNNVRSGEYLKYYERQYGK